MKICIVWPYAGIIECMGGGEGDANLHSEAVCGDRTHVPK